MTIAIGSTVDWVTLDRATRKPASAVRTSVLSFEDVQSASGQTIRCAILACNRLAPVDQLFAIGQAPTIQKDTHNEKSAIHEKAAPQKQTTEHKVGADGSVASIMESLLKDPAAIALQNLGSSVTPEPVSTPQTADRTAWMIVQHSAGRQYRGTGIENPWKRHSDEHTAWQQGFDGQPLDLSRKPQPAATSRGLFGDEP